jgi:hypothetical protein
VLEVELVGLEGDNARSNIDDLLGGDVDRTAGDLRDDSRDRRIVLVAEADDEVVDAAEALAGGIAEFSPDYEREVKDCRSKRRHR